MALTQRLRWIFCQCFDSVNVTGLNGNGLLHLLDAGTPHEQRGDAPCFSLCYFVIVVVAVLTTESMATVGGILSVRETPERLSGSESVTGAVHTVVSCKRVD